MGERGVGGQKWKLKAQYSLAGDSGFGDITGM